jgi:hypothetical protein
MVQLTPVPQALPHVPQWRGERFKSAHVPLQSVWPVGQLQAPILQIRPAAHALPHAPQFDESALVSRQRPLHIDCPAGHAQEPPLQPDAQAALQAPQCCGLVIRSTQLEVH